MLPRRSRPRHRRRRAGRAMVRWSGVSPVLRSRLPIGLTALSTGVRNLPSNIATTLSQQGRVHVTHRAGASRAGQSRTSASGFGSTRCWTTSPSTASTSTRPALRRRVLGRVAQHAPRRPAAQAAPDLLRRGVTDRRSRRLRWAATSASVSSTCIRQPEVIEMIAATVSNPAAHSQPTLHDRRVGEPEVDGDASGGDHEVDHARPCDDGCCRGTGTGRRNPTGRDRRAARRGRRRSWRAPAVPSSQDSVSGTRSWWTKPTVSPARRREPSGADSARLSGQRPGVGDRRHEVRVAGPARHDVDVQVLAHRAARRHGRG